MGEIMALGLLRAGWSIDSITMAARRPERAKEAERQTEIKTVLDPVEAIDGKRAVIIAVKPKDVPYLLTQIAPAVKPDQLVISLAAGVPIAVFERALPGVPVIRSMPNTPAAVAEGMTAYCGGSHVGDEDYAAADAILSAVGETIRLSEDLLDAVTAISGSGPAYVFLLAEALTEAAIREGLPHHAAEKLVDQMIRGSGLLLHTSEKSAFRLRAEVTSPGGTTAAAIHKLEEGGFRALMEDAVRAAADRSQVLGEMAVAQTAESGESGRAE
jgi:pyrroline-5-carboxylate reductase